MFLLQAGLPPQVPCPPNFDTTSLSFSSGPHVYVFVSVSTPKSLFLPVSGTGPAPVCFTYSRPSSCPFQYEAPSHPFFLPGLLLPLSGSSSSKDQAPLSFLSALGHSFSCKVSLFLSTGSIPPSVSALKSFLLI